MDSTSAAMVLVWLFGGLLLATTFAWLRGRAAERAEATRAAGLDAALSGVRTQLEVETRKLETAQVERDAARGAATRLQAELEAERDKLVVERETIARAREELGVVFRATSAEVLQQNSASFLALAEERFRQQLAHQHSVNAASKQQLDSTLEQMIKPIHSLMDKHAIALHALELKREGAYEGMVAQLTHVSKAHERLSSETGKLVTALARPAQRGRWGELTLRRVVELAGMTEHCDFEEQVTVENDDGVGRPDMIVHLPGARRIVVDAKVPLDAYLRALDANSDRAAELAEHAVQVRSHVNRLAARQYARKVDATPDLVLMFVPVESALSAAMEADPELHADALDKHVLIATPTLLVAMLRAVAYGWQQEAIARNAAEIAKVGAELHGRIATFVSHFEKVGRGLSAAVAGYNGAVGTLESRVLISARKLRELDATNAEALPIAEPVDVAVRAIAAETTSAAALSSPLT